jgi:flagellar basal body-associated protein FliL
MSPSDKTAETQKEDAHPQRNSALWTALKLIASVGVLASAGYRYASTSNDNTAASQQHAQRRRLQQLGENRVPSYMKKLTQDLVARRKLFDDTPPEEIKYWFEYSGPLQVSF